jgi:hypothetical protein
VLKYSAGRNSFLGLLPLNLIYKEQMVPSMPITPSQFAARCGRVHKTGVVSMCAAVLEAAFISDSHS